MTPERPYPTERDIRIETRAQALYRDLRGPRISREALLMTPTTEQLEEELKRGLPDHLQIQIAGSIAAAKETLGELKRKDGVTLHLHHVLRTGIRIKDRLKREASAIGRVWYEIEGNLQRVEGGIGHDSQEDGRRKRFIIDAITGNERLMTKDDVQKIHERHTGYTADSPVYTMIDKFDKYYDNGDQKPEPIYLQILKEAGLGPDKMDDTVDNMGSDNSRAGRLLAEFDSTNVLNEEEARETLRLLKRSRQTTQDRFDVFHDPLDNQLHDDHAEDIEVHMATADLFIKELERVLPITDPEATMEVPEQRRRIARVSQLGSN